jgi:hypothetical protein
MIDMADAQQVALRARLRNHYWLTECKPIGEATIAIMRKKMVSIRAEDQMSDAQVVEVLSDHFGFTHSPQGWTVPDLDEAREVAIGACEVRRKRASAGGLAKAAKATHESDAIGAPQSVSGNPKDF